MKFSEAMKALEEGKSVRQKGWSKETYLFIISNEIYIHHQEGCHRYKFSRPPIDDDWEIYQEPEDTELYEWRHQDIDEKWYKSSQLMTKKEAAITLRSFFKHEIHAGPFKVGKGER